MTTTATTAEVTDEGFWRLPYDHLSAVLARNDLSWEAARVYLALGYLTIGFRKDRDTVALGQIAELAHVEHRHTVRALKKLAELGLYAEEKVSTRRVIRWIIWPPPPPKPKKKSVSADVGTITVSAKRSADVGTIVSANGSANVGTLPESQNRYPEGATSSQPPSRGKRRGNGITWSEPESRFVVSPDLLTTWRRDYPQVDVEAEIRKAGQWHAANRQWRNFRAALVRWLNKAADDARKAMRPGSEPVAATATQAGQDDLRAIQAAKAGRAATSPEQVAAIMGRAKVGQPAMQEASR